MQLLELSPFGCNNTTCNQQLITFHINLDLPCHNLIAAC
jgi:hypothetical protein